MEKLKIFYLKYKHAVPLIIYAIIYMTEQLASQIPGDIARYQDSVTPAIIMIPGKSGSLGLGTDALQSSVERAVGADIL